MSVKDLLQDKRGMAIVSFILGLGLAALFQKACENDTCMIIKGPPVKEIENKIFKQDQKCYRYKPKNTSCSNKVIATK